MDKCHKRRGWFNSTEALRGNNVRHLTEVHDGVPGVASQLLELVDGAASVDLPLLQPSYLVPPAHTYRGQPLLVQQIDPSVPQPVVQSQRRPLLGPSPG